MTGRGRGRETVRARLRVRVRARIRIDQSQPDGDLLGAAVEEDGQQRRARDLVVAARPSLEPRGVPLGVKVAAEGVGAIDYPLARAHHLGQRYLLQASGIIAVRA